MGARRGGCAVREGRELRARTDCRTQAGIARAAWRGYRGGAGDVAGRLGGMGATMPRECVLSSCFEQMGLRWESWTETRSIAEPAAW